MPFHERSIHIKHHSAPTADSRAAVRLPRQPQPVAHATHWQEKLPVCSQSLVLHETGHATPHDSPNPDNAPIGPDQHIEAEYPKQPCRLSHSLTQLVKASGKQLTQQLTHGLSSIGATRDAVQPCQHDADGRYHTKAIANRCTCTQTCLSHAR